MSAEHHPRTSVPAFGLLALARVVSELLMLVSLGYVGWQIGDSGLASSLLAAGLPVAAAGVWGLWVAPKASRRLADPARLVVEVVLFAAACAGLVWAGSWAAATVLAVLYVVGTRVGRAGM